MKVTNQWQLVPHATGETVTSTTIQNQDDKGRVYQIYIGTELPVGDTTEKILLYPRTENNNPETAIIAQDGRNIYVRCLALKDGEEADLGVM